MLKSTLSATLIVIVILCLIRMDASFPPQAQVKAQSPADKKIDSLQEAIERYLPEAIEGYLEKRFDREQPANRPGGFREQRELKESRPHPEHRAHPRHHRDRDSMQEARRDREQNIDQQKQRIRKMHQAAEHLEEAGLRDLAHQVHREAEEHAAHLREQLHKIKPRDHRPHEQREIQELLHQMQNEIRKLKSEVRELKERIAERSPRQ